MEISIPDTVPAETTVTAAHHEDVAMKLMAQFFTDELIPYFGISGKVRSIAPTELVKLEIKKLYQDFNFVMEDGTWIHFEFQSTNEGIAGLRCFRNYEATASYYHKVPVTTYVLYSGNIKNPVTELHEGVNSYRIVPIIMRDKDADKLFRELSEKISRGISVTRQDLVQLALSPLMGGKTSQKERILTAFSITKDITSIGHEDIQRFEAVIYTMAEKFLDSVELNEVKEAMRMTRVGQMLYNDGFSEGVSQGISQGIAEQKLQNARSLIDILDEQIIAERIDLPLKTVQQLKRDYLEGKRI